MTEPDPKNVATLDALLSKLFARWTWILTFALLGGACGYGFAMTLQSTYRAEAVVIPSSTKSSAMSRLPPSIANLGSAFGLGAADEDRAARVATLGALQTVRGFVAKKRFETTLFADRYDANGALLPNERAASELELAMKFRNSVLAVADSKTTGLVTVSIEWPDATAAAKIANDYIAHANRIARDDARREAQTNLGYLERELAHAEHMEIREAIASLIESELRDTVIANVRVDYAYRVLDPAVPPLLRYFPRRSLFAAGGVVVGIGLGAVIALFVGVRGTSRDV